MTRSPDENDLDQSRTEVDTDLTAAKARVGNERANQADWPPGTWIFDDFIVERKLGEGGMGAVYLVNNPVTRRSFAAKKTTIRDGDVEQQFLSELQVWIDLPSYPHITKCAFYRRLHDQIVIFSEFVEGGSISRYQTDGSSASVAGMLDIAIQWAWGLAVAHDEGVVHQDVKPANVLLTTRGLVKVSDFGLARACVPLALAESSDPLVTGKGATPNYRSPEQAHGARLGPTSDIWSWAVSVMALITGDVPRVYGEQANETLDAISHRLNRQVFPISLERLLRRCLVVEPRQRLNRMREAAEALSHIYSEISGRAYGRTMPVLSRDPSRRAELSLSSAVEVYRDAAAEAVVPPDPALLELAALPRSRDGAAVARDALLDVSRRLLLTADARGAPRAAGKLAYVAWLQASSTTNPSAALALYEQAIAFGERLVGHPVVLLTLPLEGKSRLLQSLGSYADAAATVYRAVEVLHRTQQNHQQPQELAAWREAMASSQFELADALVNWDRAEPNQGNLERAVAHLGESIELWTRLRDGAGASQIIGLHLARCYDSLCGATSRLGRHVDSLRANDASVRQWRDLAAQGFVQAPLRLASMLYKKARTLDSMNHPAAAAVYAMAVDVWNGERPRASDREEATALHEQADVLRRLGDWRSAVDRFDVALGLCRQLLDQTGDSRDLRLLAHGYEGKALALMAGDQALTAMQWCRAAQQVCRQLGDAATNGLTARTARRLARLEEELLARAEGRSAP